MVIVSVMVLVSCATVPQDQPMAKRECFESKLNPYRLPGENWKPVGHVDIIVFVKNPNPKQYPKIVAVIVHPINGLLMSYAYLDGKNLVAYKIDMSRGCYVKDEINADTELFLRTKIQYYSKERLVKK